MKKHFYIILSAVVAFASCNKEAGTGLVADDGQIRFSCEEFDSAVTTRTNPASMNNLSLFISAVGVNGNTSIFTNAPFIRQGNDWKGEEDRYWPSDEATYNQNRYRFYACNKEMSGSTVTAEDASLDIVYDYLPNPTYKATNALNMKHIFARVGTMEVLAPDGYTLSDLSVTLQPVTGGTFNFTANNGEGAWTGKNAAGAAVHILPAHYSSSSVVNIPTAGGRVSVDNDQQGGLWLVPGEYELTANYTINRGDYSKPNVTKTCKVNLVQGAVNNIGPRDSNTPNIPTPEDIEELTFSVTLANWDSQNITADFTGNGN